MSYEFEPLVDADDIAELFRLHPKTVQLKGALRQDSSSSHRQILGDSADLITDAGQEVIPLRGSHLLRSEAEELAAEIRELRPDQRLTAVSASVG